MPTGFSRIKSIFLSEEVSFSTSWQAMTNCSNNLKKERRKRRSGKVGSRRLAISKRSGRNICYMRIDPFIKSKLSKQFFEGYRAQYHTFCDYLKRSPYRKSVFAENEKTIRDFVKRLLGRI